MLYGYWQLCLGDRDQSFYGNIAKNAKKRLDTSEYSKDDNRPLTIGENKKVVGLMKDELGGKIMTEFVALRAKMYAYRKIDRLTAQHKLFVACDEKHCNDTKKCVVSEGLTFDDYKTWLFHGKTIYRGQVLFENTKHEVYTLNKYKIALNRDNDKKIVQADERL